MTPTKREGAGAVGPAETTTGTTAIQGFEEAVTDEQGAKNWIVFHGNTGDNGKQALMAHDEIRQAEKEIGAIGGHLAVFLARNVFSGDRRRKNYHAHITKYAHDYKIEQN